MLLIFTKKAGTFISAWDPLYEYCWKTHFDVIGCFVVVPHQTSGNSKWVEADFTRWDFLVVFSIGILKKNGKKE